MDLRNADLSGADLSGADLRGVRLDGATLTQATMQEARAGTRRRWLVVKLSVALMLVGLASFLANVFYFIFAQTLFATLRTVFDG